MFKTSDEGKELIKYAEGLRLGAYKCPAGVWTIGYGHTATAKQGMVITKRQAESLLELDIKECEECVTKNVKAPLTQDIFDALVSFVFNFGCGRFRSSTLLRLLNQKKYLEASEQFSRWVNGEDPKTKKKAPLPGLVSRRAKERALFDKGMLELMGSPEPSSDKPQQLSRYPTKSATNAGIAVTTLGVVGAEATQLAAEVSPLIPHSDSMAQLFVWLTLVGLVIAAWGRYRVFRDKGV